MTEQSWFDSWQGKRFPLFQTDPEGHPASFVRGARKYFLEGKAAET